MPHRYPLRDETLIMLPDKYQLRNGDFFRQLTRERLPFTSTAGPLRYRRTKGESIAGILVARHLKTTDDLFDTRDSPRSRSLVASAVQWAEKIMRKVEECSGTR